MISFLQKITDDKSSLNAYAEAIVSNIRMAVLDRRCTIVWVNEKFCNLLKYSEDELIGHAVGDMDFVRHDAGFFKTVYAVISTGRSWSGEVKNKAKDGSVFWVKTTVLPIKNGKQEIETYLIFFSNITATKEALEEKDTALEKLMHSEARYRALVENQADLVSLCKANGTRIYVNSSFCKFMGKPAKRLIGTSMLETRLRGLSLEFAHKALALTVEKPELSGIFEMENAEGEKFWISMSVKGIFNPCGELFEILTIGRNVTELKNAELRKTDYIDDLERIAFMTSHNVRGPIATMLGMIELLRLNAIHTDQWNMVLDNFKKCIFDLDVYTRELGAYIYQRQSK